MTLADVGQGNVPTDLRIAQELDAKRADEFDFRFDKIAGQAVFGNTDSQHSSGNRLHLQHDRAIPEQCQVMGGSEARGA